MTNAPTRPDPWGPYVNYDDVSRLVYGRMMWRLPDMRAHWLDDRQPCVERFQERRALMETRLTSIESDADLDLRPQGTRVLLNLYKTITPE